MKYYILENEEVRDQIGFTHLKWSEQAETSIAKDVIGFFRVSTVFLGMD